VAAKIAMPSAYNRFIALIMGLFQELERRLCNSPPAPTFALSCDAPYLSGRYFAGAAWATGFMTALHDNSTGLGSRSSAVRSAVENIARYASLRSAKANALPAAATGLSHRVTVIMSERLAQGPIARPSSHKEGLLRLDVKPAAKRKLEFMLDDAHEPYEMVKTASVNTFDTPASGPFESRRPTSGGSAAE
jgi:hypothetical protein